MKMYKMIVEPIKRLPGDGESLRKSYTSPKQGSAPVGFRCVAVVGYFEKPSRKDKRQEKEEEEA